MGFFAINLPSAGANLTFQLALSYPCCDQHGIDNMNTGSIIDISTRVFGIEV